MGLLGLSGSSIKGEGAQKRRVHFTVHYGDRRISDFIPENDDDHRVKEYKTEKEVADRLRREKEEHFPLNRCLEVLRERYGKTHHYGPSRLGMWQVYNIMKKLANNDRDDEYDYETLFAFFRPHQGSPDRDVMMKFIKNRRNGIIRGPPR